MSRILPAAVVNAADWPTKPLTVIVPWAPGGMTDVTSRMLVEKFKDKLGQPVMVNNQGGAGGITGMRAILCFRSGRLHVRLGRHLLGFCRPFLLNSEPFDLDKVSYIGGYALQERASSLHLRTSLTRHGRNSWNTPRKIPAKFQRAPVDPRSAWTGLRLQPRKAGIKLNFVMFKSGGEASTALLGGHVDVCEVGSGTPAYQAGRQGKLRPLLSLSREP